MRIDFVDFPSKLPRDLSAVTCVVFDVLRATTSMVTALANGVREIRAFGSLDEARHAAAMFNGSKLLAGESRTVKPEGFDLGNRPPEFTRERVDGRTLFMATTNGTKAIRACAAAERTYIATFANATAMARQLMAEGADVVLVGSGVDGQPGGEDLDGIATVADAAVGIGGVDVSESLRTLIRSSSWLSNTFDRVERLRASPGGQNVIRAKLDKDIPFVAKLDRYDVIGEVMHGRDFATIRRVLPK